MPVLAQTSVAAGEDDNAAWSSARVVGVFNIYALLQKNLRVGRHQFPPASTARFQENRIPVLYKRRLYIGMEMKPNSKALAPGSNQKILA